MVPPASRMVGSRRDDIVAGCHALGGTPFVANGRKALAWRQWDVAGGRGNVRWYHDGRSVRDPGGLVLNGNRRLFGTGGVVVLSHDLSEGSSRRRRSGTHQLRRKFGRIFRP